MNKTLIFEGTFKTETTVIDPALPRGLKKHWLATGALIHDALKHAYLNMVTGRSDGQSMSIDEAYLILSGKAPVLRHKRTEIGRHHMLVKHNNALSLFGSHAQGIEGRLKVGFLGCPDSDGSSKHTMKIINATNEDLNLMIDIINEWSKNCYLGEKTEMGYGSFEFFWNVGFDEKLTGTISLKQDSVSAKVESITGQLLSV